MTPRSWLLAAATLFAGTMVAVPILAREAPDANATGPMTIVSRLGGKCLDAENERAVQGTRVIGYACSGKWNQMFTRHDDGTIRLRAPKLRNGAPGRELCLAASGGAGNNGDGIILWACNGHDSQKWEWDSSNRLVGMNGRCIDLEGGSTHWFGNQRAILWDCHYGDNQMWYPGFLATASSVQDAHPVGSGEHQLHGPIWLSDWQAALAKDGNRIIANGGNNIVALGGGNVIPMQRATIVALGGGHILVVTRQH